ncbi:MAG: O-methyltransferase [Acidobacteriota bacterium]
MLTLVPEQIEAYAARHTTPESDLLAELRRETYAKMAVPQMQVGRLEGTFLKILVRLVGARRVLEIGMFTGYSALMMAEGLPDDGRIVTCDVDPVAEEMARSFFARSPHRDKIEIRMGPALDTLATLDGPFDLVFIDADKSNYPCYYEAAVERVRPGGLIVIDNTLWSGAVLSPEDDDSRAIVEMARRIQDDARVENALLTVRDGMLLAYRL